MMAPKPASAYRFGECSADPKRLEVRRGGSVVALEPKAIRVLFHLIENRDRVVTKEELIAHIWAGAVVTDFALTRVIAQLRKRLGDDAYHPRYIETAATTGYRFVADVTRQHVAEKTATTPRRRVWWLAGPAVLVVLLAAAVLWLRRPNTNLATAIRATRQLTNSDAADLFPAFSPDGSQIVFSSNRTGHFELYIRSLAPGSEERQITFGGQDVIQPAWSPDGQYLACSFQARGGIATMPVSGGAVRYLSESGSGPQWSPDGRTLIYSPYNVATVLQANRPFPAATATYLMSVAADGGTPRQLTYPGDPVAAHSNARWLGDGRHILFVSGGGIWLMNAWTGHPRKLDLEDKCLNNFAASPLGNALYFTTPCASSVQGLYRVRLGRDWHAQKAELLMPVAAAVPANIAVSRDGSRLAFNQEMEQSGIWSVPIDSSGAPRGDPRPVVQDLSQRNTEPDFSLDGSMLAYASQRQGERSVIVAANADGSAAQIISPPDSSCEMPIWLTQGRCAYYCMPRALWISPLHGPPQRIAQKSKAQFPQLSRDGTRVVAHVRDASSRRMRLVVGDVNAGEIRFLTPPDRSIGYARWSPDGRWIAAEEEHGSNDAIVLISPENGRIQTLVDEPVHSWLHDWAPNNDQIVFAGLRNGLWNVYWVSRSTKRVRQLTHFQSRSGIVRYPAWSPRGDQVVFERQGLVANIYVADLR